MSTANVLAYLGAEGFRGGEADLRAEAFQERQFEGGVFGQVYRVEVEEVGFHGEGVGAEGGAVAYVGDGLEALGAWKILRPHLRR